MFRIPKKLLFLAYITTLMLTLFTIAESVAIDRSSTSLDTCEQSFSTNSCSECQKTIYSSPSRGELQGCFIDSTFSHDSDLSITTNLSNRLNTFCALPCDEKKALEFVNNLQRNCKTEISNAVDLIVVSVYSAIPQRCVLCSKDSNGEYDAVNILSQTAIFLKNVTNNFSLFDFLLNAQLLYAKPDDTTYTEIIIPDLILCSDSYKEIVNIWVNYNKQNPLTINTLQRSFDTVIASTIGNLSETCGIRINDIRTNNNKNNISNNGTTTTNNNRNTKVSVASKSSNVIGTIRGILCICMATVVALVAILFF
ncbi:1804_t:CDS:2 [Ambispora gerdemannii]|uniref:1804_t:CDS:1 n=1 Tax=Ambispora gerdemannii TaxID=144530 RepID=A0A9N9GKY8_9GLOM|nr:1804_t:CDS:2 [Ambispora gerdemannii]